MIAKATPITDVNSYIAAFPKDTQKLLKQLRAIIKKTVPGAEEIISYQIPTYKYLGPLVHFAAFPDHCSLIVVNKDIIRMFESDLQPYKTTGTTIHFKPGKPLPATLVKKIVKARIQQNEELRAMKNVVTKKSK